MLNLISNVMIGEGLVAFGVWILVIIIVAWNVRKI